MVLSATEIAASSEPDWAAETEARVLDAALPLAPRLNWSRQLVKAAGEAAGVSAAAFTN